MRGEFLLALDLGTTSVRALIVAPDGAVRGRAQRPLPTRFPAPGRVEQDPETLWVQSLEVMREALASAGLDAGALAGLGVATQRATVLAWDAGSGRALAPAVGWQDQRSAETAARIREQGLPLPAQSSASKWLWWFEHEPAVQAASRSGTLRLGNPDAWLTHQLTGAAAHVTDPGQASCTALYDLQGRKWSRPLMDWLGIEEETLPEIVPTSGVVGETPPRLLGAAVPVAARAGDQQAATFAQGVHAPGEAKLTLGTAAMLDLHTGEAAGTPAPGTFPLSLWRLSDGSESFCLEGSVITAGAVLDWLVSLGLLEGPEVADRVAAQVDSTQGVAFVPALQGLGTPFLHDGARGLLAGLTRGSSTEHVVRAALEGVAHRCVDVCETLALGERPLRVDGGLARSELLLQMLADFSGCEVQRAAETETTALGCALLAGLAVGVFESPAVCRERVAAATRFFPSDPPGGRAAVRARWRAIVERVLD
jgi:glycerol kinase